MKPLSAFCSSIPGFARPTTLYVNSDTHQRLPPISPLRQSSPSEYFSSHTERSGRLRRTKLDAAPCFSQTTTDSGHEVNSSMSSAEWVVTMSCMRSEDSL